MVTAAAGAVAWGVAPAADRQIGHHVTTSVTGNGCFYPEKKEKGNGCFCKCLVHFPLIQQKRFFTVQNSRV